MDDINAVQAVYGWTYSQAANNYIPVTYVWEPASRSYVLPQEVQLTSTVSTASSVSDVYRHTDPSDFYLRQDYDSLLEYRDTALRGDVGLSPVELSRWRYVTALEALNRPDDALTEYVAVYQAAPDSAWGKLAALHLEPVENP